MPGTSRRPPVGSAPVPRASSAIETRSVLDLLTTQTTAPGLRVLQIGTDDGSLAPAVAGAGLHVLVLAPDPAEATAVRTALSACDPGTGGRVQVLCRRPQELGPTETFRAVILPSSLVTLLDATAMERLLTTAVELLAPGGTLIVATTRLVPPPGEPGTGAAVTEAASRLTPARISEQLRAHSLDVTYQHSVPDGSWPGLLSVIIGATRSAGRR